MTLPPLHVVAVALFKDGHVLATCRATGEHAGGWEFPGGKIEPGETPQAAIVREIQEELDVTLLDPTWFMTVHHDTAAFHLVMDLFIAHDWHGPLTLKAHSECRWLSPETLDSVAWLPADEAVVNALKAQPSRFRDA